MRHAERTHEKHTDWVAFKYLAVKKSKRKTEIQKGVDCDSVHEDIATMKKVLDLTNEQNE